MFVEIGGRQKYLWRGVDQDGDVVDILVQARRDTAAVKRLFRRLRVTADTAPRRIITDELGNFRGAHRETFAPQPLLFVYLNELEVKPVLRH